MALSPDQPIGIFDSGIGGLTVAHAIRKKLPCEDLIYFGDTAHLPYGDKSVAAIQAYSIKIADVLLHMNCKVIVIACNSASSAAYDLLKEYTGSKAKVLNVIEPMVEWVVSAYVGKKVGLIGTKRTIDSNVYSTNIAKYNSGIDLRPVATPLLVPMIEEGFVNDKISRDIIDEYLNTDHLKNIDALILGCTHYPLIKQQVNVFFNGSVDILDSADVVSDSLFKYLSENDLLNEKGGKENHFMVSDYTTSFEASTGIFFGEKIHLEKHVLWE